MMGTEDVPVKVTSEKPFNVSFESKQAIPTDEDQTEKQSLTGASDKVFFLELQRQLMQDTSNMA